jgi:ATP-dependent Lon protease
MLPSKPLQIMKKETIEMQIKKMNTAFNKEMNNKKLDIKKALEIQFKRQWNQMHKEDFLDEVLRFIKEYND